MTLKSNVVDGWDLKKRRNDDHMLKVVTQIKSYDLKIKVARYNSTYAAKV